MTAVKTIAISLAAMIFINCSGAVGGSDGGDADGFDSGDAGGDIVARDGDAGAADENIVQPDIDCGEEDGGSGECSPGENPDDAMFVDEEALKGYIVGPGSTSPALAVSGCDIHVSWVDYRGSRLVYVRSNDMGSSWTDEKVLEDDEDLSELRTRPAMSAIGSCIYVIWTISDYQELFLVSSRDNGKNWGETSVLSNSIPLGSDLSIEAVEGGLIHVVITNALPRIGEESLVYLRSEDYGESWSDAEKVSDIPPGGLESDMVANGSEVHLAWQYLDERDWMNGVVEVVYKKSVDGGDTWSRDVPISDRLEIGRIMSEIIDILPSIAMSGDRVDVVWSEPPLWEEEENHDCLLFYRSSPDAGETWGEVSVVDPYPEDHVVMRRKEVASTDSFVHVISRDGYLRYSVAEGQWSEVFPERRGVHIACLGGWVFGVGLDSDGLYWIRFPE